jgi:hypothetical protein
VEPTTDAVAAFYDSLAATYDRLYPDWVAASAEQGDALHSLVSTTTGPGALRILDVAVGIGIGTQLIGLAAHGPRAPLTPREARARRVRGSRRQATTRKVASVGSAA